MSIGAGVVHGTGAAISYGAINRQLFADSWQSQIKWVYKVRVATPACVATLALHLRKNDGDAKNQYNSGYWCKASSAEHSNHATERRKAQM